MAKADVVAAQKAAVLAGQDAALESGLELCFDGGYAQGSSDQKASDGSFTQADIDAAVAAAKGLDAQALADAQAAAAASMADLQSKLADMTAKEQAEEVVVSGLQNSVAAVQSALDAIKAIVFPPAPAPAAPPSA